MAAQTSTVTVGPAELVLTATAARRYYLEEASKSEIASELGLSRFKVARLLREARASGLVRIELDYRGELDLDLSVDLQRAYGLQHAVVIDAPDADEPALRANLGRAAAGLLAEIVGPDDVLGIACGRSLMAMRTALTRLAPCTVVQLTGAIQQQELSESSIELVRDVAETARGTGYYFYAPMIVPDAQTARAMGTQADVARTTEWFPALTLAVVGLGAWGPGLSTIADVLEPAERDALTRAGVRAEVCGLTLDADGAPLATPLTRRRIGIDAVALCAVPEVIAIAYGVRKATAVRGALRGGIVKSLVTHASLARELLGAA